MADTAAPNVNQALKKLKISGVGRCFREGGHQSHVSLWLKSVHEITQYYGGLQPLEPPPLPTTLKIIGYKSIYVWQHIQSNQYDNNVII